MRRAHSGPCFEFSRCSDSRATLTCWHATIRPVASFKTKRFRCADVAAARAQAPNLKERAP